MLSIANADEEVLAADLPEVDGTVPVPILAQAQGDLKVCEASAAPAYLTILPLAKS